VLTTSSAFPRQALSGIFPPSIASNSWSKALDRWVAAGECIMASMMTAATKAGNGRIGGLYFAFGAGVAAWACGYFLGQSL
jgi:hypothetical protein